ncbi:MAG: UDP-N-acetyl glucosamine 2-epimerase [Candidatus Altiarchaeota archaeon]|nr:UDP-N-acetyl glucosamine 2-epimerase [Candidatus Altiarchaeota archaeon]
MVEHAYIVGTKAEFIKMFPLMKELDGLFIHTGQHDLSDLSKTFKIKEPDLILSDPPKGKTSKFMGSTPRALLWNVSMVKKLTKILKEERPKTFICHGDTMSTASASIAAKRAGIAGVHVEAGLRSHSIWEPFPEEISRKIADKNCEVLFAPSKIAGKNLEKYKNKKVYVTGNTSVDSAMEALKKGKNIKVPNEEYAVLSFHRHENLKNRSKMKRIVEIVEQVPIPTYFFAHDNTVKSLKRFGLWKRINKKVNAIKFANYVSFIKWLSGSRILLTDGGSIQEESLLFKKPCLLLRDRTERVAGLTTGLNFLTRFDVEFSKQKISEVLKSDWSAPEFKNPYGELGVSKKIADILRKNSA